MKATLILADHAQVSDGKLFISGGGWSIAGPGPVSMAVAVKVEVPWDRANTRMKFLLELLDADGQPVTVPASFGEQEIKIDGEFETGRPAGLKQGVPLDVALAVNVGPLPLSPDSRFSWRLTVDGQSHQDWQVGFSTRPAPPVSQT